MVGLAGNLEMGLQVQHLPLPGDVNQLVDGRSLRQNSLAETDLFGCGDFAVIAYPIRMHGVRIY